MKLFLALGQMLTHYCNLKKEAKKYFRTLQPEARDLKRLISFTLKHYSMQ